MVCLLISVAVSATTPLFGVVRLVASPMDYFLLDDKQSQNKIDSDNRDSNSQDAVETCLSVKRASKKWRPQGSNGSDREDLGIISARSEA